MQYTAVVYSQLRQRTPENAEGGQMTGVQLYLVQPEFCQSLEGQEVEGEIVQDYIAAANLESFICV